MHRALTISEIIRRIVEEYVAEETMVVGGCLRTRSGLMRLALVKPFSSIALQMIWENAGVLRLQSLGGGVTPAEGPPESVRLPPSETFMPIHLIKSVMPILRISEQNPALFDMLASSSEFQPLTLYCAAGDSNEMVRNQVADTYLKLLKPSLRSVNLYVESDQAFPWTTLLSQLPQGLWSLRILAMLPIEKAVSPPPALSLVDTHHLLSACAANAASLRDVELRFLHQDVANLVLATIGCLPSLRNFTLASPRYVYSLDPEQVDAQISRMLSTTGGETLPLMSSEPSWQALETLILRGYPLATAKTVLTSCSSNNLSSVAIVASTEIVADYSLCDISSFISSRFRQSMVSFHFEGGTSVREDPLEDAHLVIQALSTLSNLRSLRIDCHHVMSNMHAESLKQISTSMRRLERLHLSSLSEASPYSSQLYVHHLLEFKNHAYLNDITIEISDNFAHSSDSPMHEETKARIEHVCLIGPRYTPALEETVRSIFIHMKKFECKRVPYVN